MSHAFRQRSLPGLGAENDAPPQRAVAAPPQASLSPEQLRGRTLYAVDAHSLIFQVFHALPEMTSPRGEPVGAVYGFTRDMLFLLEQKKPDFLLCAFDSPGGTFRHEFFDGYKADRGSMPDELASQLPRVREVLDALGIPVLAVEKFEADDILATVARVCDELGVRCHVVTGDKDCRQLITDHVSVYNVRKDEVYDAAALEKDWGIRPDQVVDFQALVGDSVDCVPGVALIGPKIARELLATYGTLDEVLDRAHEMKPGKRTQNLIEGREIAELSRRLARLDCNVPVEIDWTAAEANRSDEARLAELFAELGFRGFGERVGRLGRAPAARKIEAEYHTVDTPEKLAKLVEQLKKQPRVSLDTETTSLHPRQAKLVGYSFSWEPGQGYYVPVRAPEGEPRLDPDATREALRPVLEDPNVEKIGQNLKYDMQVLRAAGVELRGLAFDTMIASYLLDAGERNHRLDDLARRYLNHRPTSYAELVGTGKNPRTIDQVPVAEVTHYAGEDADLPVRLLPILNERLAEAELEPLFHDVEMPLVEVLAEMEYHGMRLDIDRMAELSTRYESRLKAVEQEIYQLAGRELNIASRNQLAEVLFDELKLPVIKKTKTGPSTDADVLAQLARLHELPAKIVEYRQYAKLKNTYVDALPKLVDPGTGRIHASLNQVVTATGRLSSSDPNLQNIPVRHETGREIRSAFLPAEGWKLLAADYSQIELRVLAHFSQDETLCQAFHADQDIHARVAGEVYQVPQSEVTAEMRRAAKAVNFGIVYGQSPYGLAAALGIEQDQAAAFIDAYFARYPGVEKFLEQTLANCRETGYVKTILGRRRGIRGIRPSAGRQRNLPERTAVNTVIQGSAADLIKLAMIQIHRRLQRERHPARMLLQIHDELIFEVPADRLDDLAALAAEEMAAAAPLTVPLKVDLKSGDNWADCEPWTT